MVIHNWLEVTMVLGNVIHGSTLQNWVRGWWVMGGLMGFTLGHNSIWQAGRCGCVRLIDRNCTQSLTRFTTYAAVFQASGHLNGAKFSACNAHNWMLIWTFVQTLSNYCTTNDTVFWIHFRSFRKQKAESGYTVKFNAFSKWKWYIFKLIQFGTVVHNPHIFRLT